MWRTANGFALEVEGITGNVQRGDGKMKGVYGGEGGEKVGDVVRLGGGNHGMDDEDGDVAAVGG